MLCTYVFKYESSSRRNLCHFREDDSFPRNFISFPGKYLKDLEAVLDVLRVDLRDEEKVAHLPRV